MNALININPEYALLLFPVLALVVFIGVQRNKDIGYNKIRARIKHRVPLSDTEYGSAYPKSQTGLAIEIRSMLADYLGINRHQVYASDELSDDLGFRYCDELALVEFVMNVEQKFTVHIPDDRMSGNLVRVQDLVEIISELQSRTS